MDDESQSESRKPFLDRLLSRTMSDIRIHANGRAGELTRRLGARAFTVGRDVYVRPELVEPMTPEGEALIAHELTHVAEQTGREPSDLPLLRPQTQTTSQSISASASVQRALPASLSSSEARAERTEGGARQSAQSSGAQGTKQDAMDNPTPPDAEELAERVYRMMAEELVLDRERGAHLW